MFIDSLKEINVRPNDDPEIVKSIFTDAGFKITVETY